MPGRQVTTAARSRRPPALKRDLPGRPPGRAGQTLGWTALFFAFLFLVFRPYYLTNDDGYTTLAALGYSQPDHQPSWFLPTSNLLVTSALHFLDHCFGIRNWYGGLLLSALFLSGWVIGTTLSRKWVWAAVYAAVLWAHYFTHMEFTLSAFFLAVAGLILLFNATPKPSQAPIVGACLWFLGALIRPEAASLASLGLLPWAFTKWRMEKSPIRARKVLLLAGVCALTFGAQALNRQYWDQDPSGRNVHPYIKTMQRIVEYRGLTAGPTADRLLAGIGWDSLDFALYSNFDWRDPRYSLEKTRQLLAHMPPPIEGKSWGWTWVFRGDFMRFQLFCLFALCLFLPRRDLVWFILNALWIFGIFLGLYYEMKVNQWVTWPLFSLLGIIGFLGIPTPGPKPGFSGLSARLPGARPAVLFLALLCAATLLCGDFTENRKAQAREAALQQDLRALQPGQDHLYVVWNRGLPVEDLGVLGNYGAFQGIPVYWMNGWQNDPDSLEIIQRHGLSDPLREMVNRKDIYLILPDYYVPLLGHFIREKLHLDPTLVEVHRGAVFNVYQVEGRPFPGAGKSPASYGGPPPPHLRS